MWIDRAVKWLLPRDQHFFDLLERGADCARRCGALLVECCDRPTHAGRLEVLGRIRGVEHESDRVIHEVSGALNRTFVTPLDRSDIYALAAALEGVVDDIDGSVSQLEVHAIEDLPAGSRELAAVIRDGCEAIAAAVGLLRGLKDPGAIRERCQFLNDLESDGDRIFRTHIGALFRAETDAIRLIKAKEFLEGLERAVDSCDDVGNALETIVLKNA